MTDAQHPQSELPTPPPNATEARLAWLLFAAATALAVVFVLVRAPQTYSSLYEASRIGAHIAAGHGFASPIDPSPAAAATNWLPPVYPYLIAAAYTLFGIETPAALNTLLLLNALCFGLLVSGAYLVGREAFGGRAGLFAALGVLLHPLFVLRTAFYWDTYPALALFVWLLVAALRIGRGAAGNASAAKLAGLGAGLGLLALTNVSYVLTSPVLVLLALRKQGWGLRVSRSALALASFALVIAPWTWRNYDEFGEWMLIRGGPYLEIWLGNQPGATGWIDVMNHPLIDPDEGRHFNAIGESAYWALSKQRVAADYAADPSAFWLRTARRAVFVLVGPVSSEAIRLVQLGPRASLARMASDVVLLLLAVYGFLLARRVGPFATWLLAAGMASVLPFLFTQVAYRYVMPLKLVLILLAGVAAARLFEMASEARRTARETTGARSAGH